MSYSSTPPFVSGEHITGIYNLHLLTQYEIKQTRDHRLASKVISGKRNRRIFHRVLLRPYVSYHDKSWWTDPPSTNINACGWMYWSDGRVGVCFVSFHVSLPFNMHLLLGYQTGWSCRTGALASRFGIIAMQPL